MNKEWAHCREVNDEYRFKNNIRPVWLKISDQDFHFVPGFLE